MRDRKRMSGAPVQGPACSPLSATLSLRAPTSAARSTLARRKRSAVVLLGSTMCWFHMR